MKRIAWIGKDMSEEDAALQVERLYILLKQKELDEKVKLRIFTLPRITWPP